LYTNIADIFEWFQRSSFREDEESHQCRRSYKVSIYQ